MKRDTGQETGRYGRDTEMPGAAAAARCPERRGGILPEHLHRLVRPPTL